MTYRGSLFPIPLGLKGLTGDAALRDASALTIAENFEFRHNRIVRAFGLVQMGETYEGTGGIDGMSTTSSPYDSELQVIRGFHHHGPWGHKTFTFKPERDRPPQFVEAGRESPNRLPKLFSFFSQGLPTVSQDGHAPITIEGPPNAPPYSNALVYDQGALVTFENAVYRRLFYGRDDPNQNPSDPATNWILDRPTLDRVPPEWNRGPPQAGALVANRMWAIAGHRVFYSSPTDHEDFVSLAAGSLSVFPGEGDQLVAITPFRGLVLLWKYPRGLYVVDPRSILVTEWSVRRLSDKLGCIGSQAIAGVDQDIIFIDTGGGVHSLSATEKFGDVSSSDITQISEVDEWMLENVDFRALNEVRMAYDEFEKELHVIMPSRPLRRNIRMVISFVPEIRFRIHTTGDPTSILMWRETSTSQHILIGMRDGRVFRIDPTLNIGSVEVDHDGILRAPFHIRTVPLSMDHIDARLHAHRKNHHQLTLRLYTEGGIDLVATVTTDETHPKKLVPFSRIGGAALASVDDDVEDQFILGESPLETERTITMRRRIGVSAQNLVLDVVEDPETDPKGNFEIVDAFVSFKSLGEGLTNE